MIVAQDSLPKLDFVLLQIALYFYIVLAKTPIDLALAKKQAVLARKLRLKLKKARKIEPRKEVIWHIDKTEGTKATLL